jgi:hypothetical protein
MQFSLKSLFLVVIAFCALSEAAFAWGPATHIGLGEAALSQLALLPGALAAILGRNALSYLYGSIAADVVFAKRWSRVKQFCHHWSTGFRLLDTAEDDRAQAFAYGYLSHLAADTIAHGKYVPHQIATYGTTRNFGHFYWELRADSAQPEPTWVRLQTVLDIDHRHHHREMRPHITDTLLSYPMNRVLFDGMNALAVRQSFRRTIDTWSRLSRWPLRPDLLRGYESESVDRILSVLAEGRRSPVLREDPNGTAAFMNLSVRRAEDRRRSCRGVALDRRRREVSHEFAPRRIPVTMEAVDQTNVNAQPAPSFAPEAQVS